MIINRLTIVIILLMGCYGIVSACPSRMNRHVDPLPDGPANLAYTVVCVSFLEIYGGEVETPSTIALYRRLWSVCVERNEAGEPRFGPSHLLFSVRSSGDPIPPHRHLFLSIAEDHIEEFIQAVHDAIACNGDEHLAKEHAVDVRVLGDPVVQLRVESGSRSTVVHSEIDDLTLSEIMVIHRTETFRDTFCRECPGVLEIELHGSIAGETIWDGFALIDLSHDHPCGQ